MTEDSLLLSEIAAGSQRAFAIFYGKFKDKVYRTAFSYVRNEADAEEVAQDVFVEISKSAKAFNHKSAINTWVFKITVNKSLDKLRYQKAKKRFGFLTAIFGEKEEALKDTIADPEHHGWQADKKESLKILLSAIAKLPENQKTAIILTQLEQLKGKEAAEVMGTTAKAIEGLVLRGKAALKKEVEKIYHLRGKYEN